MRTICVFLVFVRSAIGQATDVDRSNDLELRTAAAHPIKYYLALPKDHQREDGRRWAVLICLTGAGGDVRENAERFRQARADLPVIIVAPWTFSNINRMTGDIRLQYRRVYADAVIDNVRAPLDWDEHGILAIIEDLKASHRIEPRVYLTGFSGGGLATYRMILKHPQLIAGAAPVCANFFQDDYRQLKTHFAPQELEFPIHQISGAEDPLRKSRWFLPMLGVALAIGYVLWKRTRKLPWKRALAVVGLVIAPLLILLCIYGDRLRGMDAQRETAERLLRERGYSGISQTVVPGMGHFAAPEQVIDAFRQFWQ